jgi:hypothetical protein
MRFISVDLKANVAHTDDGGVFEVDSYTDADEEPCLPEEAVFAHVRIGSTRFKRVRLEAGY